MTGPRDVPRPRSVAEMKAIIANAEQMCRRLEVDPAEAPWYVGLVRESLESVSPEVLAAHYVFVMGQRAAQANSGSHLL